MRNKFHALILATAFALAMPARAELAVVVNPAMPQASMTKEEVAQYFLGKSGALTPVDQSEDAPIRAEFYRKVADKDPAQTRALWAKLVFTGKAVPPRDVGGNAEVKKTVAANPKAIGYIDKSAVDATVKVICTVP